MTKKKTLDPGDCIYIYRKGVLADIDIVTMVTPTFATTLHNYKMNRTLQKEGKLRKSAIPSQMYLTMEYGEPLTEEKAQQERAKLATSHRRVIKERLKELDSLTLLKIVDIIQATAWNT